MKKDPRVEAYIAKAQPFAQPILTEVRKRVEKANPGIEETIKWNVPFYLLDGKILASTAAFKQHVKVGVWVGKQANFQDVTALSELISAKDFAAKLSAAIAESGSAMKSAPTKAAPAKATAAKAAPPKVAAKKAPVKKTVAKKAPAKVAVAEKAPAKKAVAKKAAVKKTPAEKAGKR